MLSSKPVFAAQAISDTIAYLKSKDDFVPLELHKP